MIKKICSGIVKYYAIFLNVVFSLELGYVKYKTSKNRNIVRFWLLLQSSAMIAYCLKNSTENNHTIFFFFWCIGYCSHYYFLVLISQFSKKDISFRKLSADLNEVLGIDDDNLEIKMAVTIMFTFAYRIFDLYYFILRVDDLWSPKTQSIIILTCITLCADMVQINCAFLFYAPLCRLKTLANTLMTGNVDFRTGQRIYKSIVDVTEKYTEAITLLYMTSFFCTTFETLAVMSEGVYGLLQSVDTLRIARIFNYMAANCLMSFAPALTAGRMTSQASKIKLILMEKLMEEFDPRTKQDIDRFLGYIGVRPLRLRMCRVFPLNTDLIGAMLYFTVQHMIVIVQFRY